MSALDWIMVVWAGATSLLWVALFVPAIPRTLRTPLFADVHPCEPAHWPRLSVLVAARDEAETLEAAAQTLLAQDYPDLELVLVDDRSTDGTTELIDRLAAGDRRVVAVHIRQLPDGWLGKVHALKRAADRASGQWLLFTDADVRFSPGVLRRAVAQCLERGLDHLALLSDVRTHGFWQEVATVSFGALLFSTARVDRVGQPGAAEFMGVGTFNLVRRGALERTEGLGWLRMEVADDMGLGLLLKRGGARGAFALAQRDLCVDWYPSLSAMVRGLEKNLFGVLAHYSYAKAAVLIPTIALGNVGPFVALFYPGVAWLWILGLAAMVSLGAMVAVLHRHIGRPFFAGLLIPVGNLILAFIALRSTLLAWRRGGIVWRETTYPLGPLRAGQRVRLGWGRPPET